MIPEKSLVLYKTRPAVVSGTEGDKISISVQGNDQTVQALKVREKDIELLHPGPCSLKDLEGEAPAGDIRGAWELLAADRGGEAVSLKELAELAWGEFSPAAAWAAWEAVGEGVYFTGDLHGIRMKSAREVGEAESKRGRRRQEAEERSAFLGRLRAAGNGPALTEADRRYLQDVEALAWGRTDKSRTLKELGRPETPQEAHRLLLASGAWTPWANPNPRRFGLSPASAAVNPGPPPSEDREDLTRLNSYAIDSPWSDDPDDAVSLAGPDSQGRHVLWVHVADPAASIPPGSPCDTEARSRGVTLYLPEGSSRMISPAALDFFALGLREDGVSPALSFKILLNADLTIAETAVVPSLVKVTRLSYEAADRAAASGGDLARLFALAERNTERRLNGGAVLIDFPEVHISVSIAEEGGGGEGENLVSVEPVGTYRSAAMVRECMVLAGEGAARWALRNQTPFPFIAQEAGDLPSGRLPGLAGAWQMRRCMRPRTISTKPAVHWGLGLDQYTQVTSPLRRYTDLLCHQQIRAFLKGGGGGGRGGLLSEDEVLLRVSAAEAAALAASRAERASRAHWLAVYLSGKKGSSWEGVVLDLKGNRGVVFIPALGLETQVSIRGNLEPNDPVALVLKSANISEGTAVFVEGS
jgi:exoribonuclease-2